MIHRAIAFLTHPAFRWGVFVVMFLTGQIALGVTAIVLSKSDPSVAVVPDYYNRAVHWDEERRERNRSLEMAWTVDVIASRVDKTLEFQILDDNQERVFPEQVDVEIYRHARASQQQQLSWKLPPMQHNDLNSAKPASPSIVIPAMIDHSGLWQVDISIRCEDGRTYVESREINIE